MATANKNDVAKLLSLWEIGEPRISHVSGAKVIHSKLFSDMFACWLSHAVVRLVALSPSLMRGERCRRGAEDPALNAVGKRVCCTPCVSLEEPSCGL